MTTSRLAALVAVAAMLAPPAAATAAYPHQGEGDAATFTSAYPARAGTKLDSCALCHAGGTVTVGGKTTVMGSCQWCHSTYGYAAPHGDLAATLNAYGKDYLAAGRSAGALRTIEPKDSDGDGFANLAELDAETYPGDAGDDPTKVVAPFVVYTRAQLAHMPQHAQLLLMNTTKSGDYYARYSGVPMEELLRRSRMTSAASRITVFSPDGYATGHPLEDTPSNAGALYQPFVNGTYPQAPFYYDAVADAAHGGWCDYGSRFAAGRSNGEPIVNPGGLRLLVALRADGIDLAPGYLGSTNALVNEGPFRTITPQKVVGPPDQPKPRSSSTLIWPYDTNADHNAGYSVKAATIVRVEPLPPGTTDVDVLEAGWKYVDEGKLVVYGALEQLALLHPRDGAVRTPWRHATFEWARVRDPDPRAAVSYALEYTSGDPVKGPWTRVSVTPEPRRAPEGKGGALLALLLGDLVRPGCVDGRGDDDPRTWFGWGATARETVRLERHTTYHWRVIADGPASHNVSAVRSFTTGP